MDKQYIINYVKNYFPTQSTQSVADHLHLTASQVRTIAKKYNIKKCKIYKKKLKIQLVINRKKWYEDNIPELNLSFLQEQILLGSLLGDGYISEGAARSINCYYQEHFGEKQRGYREWKLSQLNDKHFSIKGNYLRSISHPYFTKLHAQLYQNKIKTLTQLFLKKCTHPLFLATLYLDDGSLIISYQYNKNTHTVYCHPSIVIYTLNLTREENSLLATHINKTFQTNFVVSGHPDGHKTLLKLNKESEVTHFLETINAYVKDIPSMQYKTSLKKNIAEKTEHIQERYGKDVHIRISSSNRKRHYSEEDITILMQMKKDGATDQMIADRLGRSYWSVVYKIRQLKRIQHII